VVLRLHVVRMGYEQSTKIDLRKKVVRMGGGGAELADERVHWRSVILAVFNRLLILTVVVVEQ
jgi:hypothetical protein